jgi:hypothetical protein
MGKSSRKKWERRSGIGGYKVSDALSQLIEPFKYEDFGLAEYRKLVALGAAAWNIALLPEPKASEVLQEMAHGLCSSAHGSSNPVRTSDSDVHVVETLVRDLIKRKTELFPHDRRFIGNVEVAERTDKYHITVTSTPLAK